jgi:hypothetical protein
MLYFPQLTSGASAQYPFAKRRVHRTIVNLTPDGRLRRLSDPDFARIEWELKFNALTTEERTEIEEFFRAVEGRLGEFTFLDPTDNLLVRSGELTSTPWAKEPLLTLASGVTDPAGGEGATRITNPGPASQKIEQIIHGPSWFQYSFSFYARSDSPVSLELLRTAGGSEESAVFPVNATWQRLTLSGKSPGSAESVAFGIRLGAQSSVEVYGMQAEAQPAPSTYRKTAARSGVYETARLDHDALVMVSEGPEEHSCTLRVVAPLSN